MATTEQTKRAGWIVKADDNGEEVQYGPFQERQANPDREPWGVLQMKQSLKSSPGVSNVRAKRINER